MVVAALLVVALGTAVTRAASKHQPARAASAGVQVTVGRGEVGSPGGRTSPKKEVYHATVHG